MRHVVLLAFDGVQLLDVAGPASVFGAAAEAVAGAYRVTVAAADSEVRSSCGVSLKTCPASKIDPASADLLLIAGGDTAGLRATVRDTGLRDWTTAVAATAERYGSVCTGAFLLAAWGLADGRRVATHWQGSDELARRYPQLSVDADALYVEDGRLWTSAGITTGIDMSLALVERDHGAAVATAIARRLVLHGRRSGHQSQFSALLEAQSAALDSGYAALIDWMQDHLAEPLDIEVLAARANQSVRNFHRRFAEATGQTPAAFVARLRLDRARALLDAGMTPQRAAADSGFGSSERLARAFGKTFGISPAAYAAVAVRKAA